MSQTKRLAKRVAGARTLGRVSLAAMGRAFAEPEVTKDRIQGTWRFTANQRVFVSDALQGLVRRLGQ